MYINRLTFTCVCFVKLLVNKCRDKPTEALEPMMFTVKMYMHCFTLPRCMVILFKICDKIDMMLCFLRCSI